MLWLTEAHVDSSDVVRCVCLALRVDNAQASPIRKNRKSIVTPIFDFDPAHRKAIFAATCSFCSQLNDINSLYIMDSKWYRDMRRVPSTPPIGSIRLSTGHRLQRVGVCCMHTPMACLRRILASNLCSFFSMEVFKNNILGFLWSWCLRSSRVAYTRDLVAGQCSYAIISPTDCMNDQ